MRKILLSLLLGVMISTMAATSALAEYVLVTKSGKKYHHIESRYADMDNVEKITLEEAEERGLEPSKQFLRTKEQLEKEAQASKSSKKEKKK